MSVPISILATGMISIHGTLSPIRHRKEQNGTRHILDNSRIFHLHEFQTRRIPFLLPPYVKDIKDQTSNNPPLFGQLNTLASYSTPEGKEGELLHTIVSFSGNRICEIETGAIRCLESIHRITEQAIETENTKNIIMAIERDILVGKEDAAHKKIEKMLENDPQLHQHPRFLFALAVCLLRRKHYQDAKELFHRAHCLGHPDGLIGELQAENFLSAPFRREFDSIFRMIQNGERLRALTYLRPIARDNPRFGQPVLAYCLRWAGEPEEGILSCRASLEVEPLQSDLYAHLWCFYTELEDDQSAQQTAQLHLKHYPHQALPYRNALESSLLLNERDLGIFYAHGYLLHATNLHQALKHLFHTYSSLLPADWKTLSLYFERILPLIRSPHPETLVRYGETLLELERFQDAQSYLEYALRLAPHDGAVILANARSLARQGRLPESVSLLKTALNDRNRTDPLHQQIFMITLLSEILRFQGESESALALWTVPTPFDETLLRETGAQPFLEFAYCLIEAGTPLSALPICHVLEKHLPNDPLTKRLSATLHEIQA